MKKRIIALGLIIIMLQSIGVSVYAATKSEVQEGINSTSAELKQVEGKLSTEMQAIDDLSTQIVSVEQELIKLNGELSELEKSIAEKNKEIEKKQEDLEEQEALLQERLVVLYEAGDTSYLDVLLAGNLVDFLSNYYMIAQIAEFDTNVINKIEKDKNEIEEIKNKLEEDKNKVETVKQERETKKANLNSKKAEKDKKVSALTSEQKELQSKLDAYNNEMARIKAAEKAALEKENSSSSGSGNYNGGQLAWPTPGYSTITSPYGYRIHPIYGTRKFHSGIDIGAPRNANIVAAESGTVILASWGYNGGYGNYIIISHGNGLTTRYAHCNSLLVSVGQKVSRGETIAKVGTTGDSTGNHLHFEVRINGETESPMNYL